MISSWLEDVQYVMFTVLVGAGEAADAELPAEPAGLAGTDWLPDPADSDPAALELAGAAGPLAALVGLLDAEDDVDPEPHAATARAMAATPAIVLARRRRSRILRLIDVRSGRYSLVMCIRFHSLVLVVTRRLAMCVVIDEEWVG